MCDRPKGAAALEALGDRLFATPAEVADVLGYDVKTVLASLRSGEIPSTRAGQRYKISTAWLRRQIDPAGGQS